MGSVTSISELSSYSGNAALAGGEGAMELGQATSDFRPLEVLALKAYETNKVNYEREEAERKKMEEQLADPNINIPLDKELAEQIDPKLTLLFDMMKKRPELYQDKEAFYKWKEDYKGVLQDSAKLKTVQAEKDKYKKLAGAERDEQKKLSYENHVKALEGYKLGQDIPAYNATFDLRVNKDLPKFVTGTRKYARVNGNNEEEVEETIINPIDGVELARKQAALDPDVSKGRETLVRGVLNHGDIEYYNAKMKKAYDDAFALNYEGVQEKYKDEFATFKKANPQKTFEQFMTETGKGGEVTDIIRRLSYLKKPLQYVPGVDENGDGIVDEQPLPGITYDQNGMRLNVDDDTMAAIISAIDQPVGRQVRVLSSKLSTKPAEIAKTEAEADKVKKDAESNRRKADAYVANQRASAAQKRAMANKINKQAAAINPLPPSEVPLIAREAVLKTAPTFDNGKVGKGEDFFVIDPSKIPDALKTKAGFYKMPTPPKKTASKEEKAEYERQKKMANTMYQMRFFAPNGEDQTSAFAKVIKNGKGTLDAALKEMQQNGYIVKFVDAAGNVVGTTETIDRQTLIENNKTNTDKETPLGNELPVDDEENF